MGSVQVIYLSRRDSVHSARELLRSAAPGGQVWLVVPWRAGWARSLVNLRLLRRVAEGAGIDLRLVSQHLETRTLAREAGLISHFFVPPPLLRYRADRSRLVPVQVEEGERWQRRPRQFGVGTVLISFGLIAGLIAILFGSAAVFIPRATVRLEPSAQRFSGHIDVRADPRYSEIDYGEATVPARYIQVGAEGTGEVPATGRIETPDGVATGEVIFANRTDAPVRIPKGTVVRTSSGLPVAFYTTTDAEVPGRLYASTRVGIVAQEPGLAGNVKELTINVVEGSLASSVDALNDTPTSGGTTKAMPMVVQEDLDRLPGETRAKLTGEAYERLIAELSETEFVPFEAQEALVMERYLDSTINQRADVATMRMRVLVNGLALDTRDLEGLAIRYLETRQEGEYQVIASSLALSRSSGVLQLSDDGMPRWFDLTLSVEGLVGPVIDTEAIEAELLGKTVGQARAWLEEHLDLRAEPEIEVSPGGWPFLPRLGGQLDIEIIAEAD
ncbi:MAG: hypothetical protein GX649_12555 [Chloroflexi bacterium]|nr:hypothetical protein [Chloroflexota bacterium]